MIERCELTNANGSSDTAHILFAFASKCIGQCQLNLAIQTKCDQPQAQHKKKGFTYWRNNREMRKMKECCASEATMTNNPSPRHRFSCISLATHRCVRRHSNIRTTFNTKNGLLYFSTVTCLGSCPPHMQQWWMILSTNRCTRNAAMTHLFTRSRNNGSDYAERGGFSANNVWLVYLLDPTCLGTLVILMAVEILRRLRLVTISCGCVLTTLSDNL